LTKLPHNEQALLLLAFALCGLFRFMLLCIPFRYLVRYMVKENKCKAIDSSEIIKRNCLTIARIIDVVATKTPWESKCLVCALVAKTLLRIFYYPNELYLGVKKDKNGKLIAHAWLNSYGYNISGGSDEANIGYAVVGKYFDE